MMRFVAAFSFTYVVSIVLIEWVSGIAFDPQTAAATHIATFVVSVLSGAVAVERGKAYDREVQWKNSVRTFTNAGR